MLNILLNAVKCPQCNKLMNLTENKNYKDGCVWRYAKKGISKHDNKINISYDRFLQI